MNIRLRDILIGIGVALAIAIGAAVAFSDSSEQAYLDKLTADARFASNDEQVLLSQGRLVCEKLDNGATVNELLLGAGFEAMTLDTDAGKAGFLMGAAVRELCPRHIPAGY